MCDRIQLFVNDIDGLILPRSGAFVLQKARDTLCPLAKPGSPSQNLFKAGPPR